MHSLQEVKVRQGWQGGGAVGGQVLLAALVQYKAALGGVGGGPAPKGVPALARAGASALGEFPAAGLPAVLAPYAGVNQMDNAQALAGRGAAVIVRDEELSGRLAPTVLDLLRHADKLAAMRAAMASLARPQAAQAIAAEIVRLGTE